MIRIACERFDSGPWYAVVMGQSGIEQGVALYEDLLLLHQLLAGQLSDEEYGRRTSALSVTFGEAFEIAPEDFDLAEEHRWSVAGPEAYQDFVDVGAMVVGVSSDSADSHQAFAERRRLPYLLAADKGGALRRAFGVPKTLGFLPGRHLCHRPRGRHPPHVLRPTRRRRSRARSARCRSPPAICRLAVSLSTLASYAGRASCEFLLTADPAALAMTTRNSRIGLALFALYLALYAGFVLLAAFAPKTLEATPLAGVNLAIWYGFGLIVAAFVLALIYGWACRASAALPRSEPGRPDPGAREDRH